MASLSGKQHVIARGRQRAVITEVGASLRAYEAGGEPVCWGFAEEELSSGGRGQVLAPWPNRIGDGRYEFQGVRGTAAWDEPDRRNAIHGLVRWLPFRLEARGEAAVRCTCELLPQPAYPFPLHLELEYRLEAGGLEVETWATNLGQRPAPFGLGFHDYLQAGPGGTDELLVDLQARRRLLLDDRLLPIGEEAVAGTPYHAVAPSPGATPGRVGALRLDDCFTDLLRDGAGRWQAEVRRGEDPASAVRVWADERFGWIMCFSGDSLAPELRRKAIAIEPMTCPPDAFRTGEGLVTLAPGETFRALWGIAPAAT